MLLFIFGILLPVINNWGHGGGMAAGILLGYAFGYQERRSVRLWHKWLAGGCVLATLLVLVYAVVTAFLIRLS